MNPAGVNYFHAIREQLPAGAVKSMHPDESVAGNSGRDRPCCDWSRSGLVVFKAARTLVVARLFYSTGGGGGDWLWSLVCSAVLHRALFVDGGGTNLFCLVCSAGAFAPGDADVAFDWGEIAVAGGGLRRAYCHSLFAATVFVSGPDTRCLARLENTRGW